MSMNCPENYWSLLKNLEIWKVEYFTIYGCISITTVLTLTSNIAVILSIFQTKQTGYAFCKLVLFLSLSDCLLACTFQTFTSIVIFKSEMTCIFQIASQFFIAFFFLLSPYIILATAFERMISIKSSLPRNQNTHMKRAHLIGLACVLLALLTDVSLTIFTAYGMYHSFDVIMQLVALIGFLSSFLLYMAVYRRVCSHVRKTVTLRNTRDIKTNTRPDRPIYVCSAARVIKRTLATQFFAFMPYAVLNLCLRYGLNTNNPRHIKWMLITRHLTAILNYFNSTMNALIFMTGNKRCRRFVKVCVTRKKC